MTVETASKSTWNPYGGVIKKTEIKKLYDLLHKASTSVEREEIMRNAIRFSPEYETVFKNLIRNINDAFTTDRNCYKQFKDILYSFLDSMDDSGKPVQFTIKITTGSRSRSRSGSRGKGKSASPPAKARSKSRSPSKCALPTPLQPSPQNSISNLSDLKLGIFVTAFLTCDESQRAPFVKQYIYATRPNGDSSPEFVDVISSDMNTIIRYGRHLSESELISKIITHLKDTKVDNENMDEGTIDDIFILYPFPQIHMTMTRKGRRPSIRNLGGGRGMRRGKGRKTRRFK
jgi:hypothetical protein